MSEITTDEKFDQLIKSNEELKEIATYFQNEVYIAIGNTKDKKTGQYKRNKQDDNTNIVLDSVTSEISKLQNKEFTIVIVGEVKAGKSTLINALIGYDIAHARTKAATTYPVRIKHLSNKKGIDFQFKPNDEFWSFAKKTADAIKHTTSERQAKLKEFHNTVSFITENKFTYDSFNQDNLGINEVRKLLEYLHDFPRVYTILFIKNLKDLDDLDDKKDTEYLDDVMNIGSLPTITLEFRSLKHLVKSENMGSIVLIDTPGIGEKGNINRNIAKIIKTEIAGSSATMAVLEKGGRNSGNEASIKKFMEDCKTSSYIIASKMDDYNKSGNDTSISELTSLIKDKFKSVDVQKVFPVSQQDALIGLMALEHLSETGSLADPYDDPSIQDPQNHWTKELIKEVYRRKEVNAYINKTTGYKEFLKETADKEYDEVIKNDYLRNPNRSFQKLADKFQEIGENSEGLVLSSAKVKFDQNLDMQSNSITKAINIAKADTETLKQSIAYITQLKHRSENALQNMNRDISNIEINIDKFISDMQEHLDNAVSTFLNGDENIEAENTSVNEHSSSITFKGFASQLWGMAKEVVAGDSLKDRLSESNFQKILEETKDFIDKQIDIVNQSINALSNNVNQELVQIPNEILSIHNDMNDELKQKFNIDTSTPELVEIETNGFDIEIDQNQYVETKYRQREKTGAWNTIKGWFGGDKYETVSYRELNTDRLYEGLKTEIGKTTENIIGDFQRDFKVNTKYIKHYQTKLSKYIDDILTELNDNIVDNADDAEKMKMLQSKMDEMQSDIINLRNMVQGI